MANKTGSNYEYIDSPIDALDPVVKLLSVLCLGISASLFPSPILAYLIVVFLFYVSYKAKVLKKFSKFMFSFAVPIFVMLTFIQGFFSPKNKTILFDFGFAKLGLEGLVGMFKIVGILLVFLGAFWITTKTSDVSRMVASFKRIGIRGNFGYLVLATLNVVPQMQRRMTIIQEAQNARGLETEGNLMTRFKAFIPLVGPVIMGSLVDVQERGMTLEARGFGIRNVRQTSMIESKMSAADQVVQKAMIIFFIGVAVSSLILKIKP